MNLSDVFLEEYKQNVLCHIELPSMLKGKYEVESCLKSSEGREVLLLRTEDDKGFILKTQPYGQDDTLKNEFEQLRQLSHPNLPQAVDCFLENGMEYFLCTYVEGTSLYDHILQKGLFDEQKSIVLVIPLCETLGYLHGQNPPIIHRDIKLQNVILSPDGSCKLIDLGTARHFKEGELCADADQGGVSELSSCRFHSAAALQEPAAGAVQRYAAGTGGTAAPERALSNL